jgi:hypothetical protein
LEEACREFQELGPGAEADLVDCQELLKKIPSESPVRSTDDDIQHVGLDTAVRLDTAEPNSWKV